MNILITTIGSLFLAGAPLFAQAADSAFGSSERKEASLIGIFYDLKQDQKRQPVNADYMKVLGQFLDSGWDENVLDGFFRVTRPVYSTQVFIPFSGAGGAPAAFGVEDVVRPQQWFVVYKGQVSPPESGTYRFVGIADDALAVAVNGKTSLVSLFGGWPNHSRWREPEPDQPNIQTPYGKLRHGDWFTCGKDEIIDLDILVGEFPGTAFGAWLFIEKKGAAYPSRTDPKLGEQPVLPVFQVAPRQIDTAGQDLPFTTDSPPWTAHQ